MTRSAVESTVIDALPTGSDRSVSGVQEPAQTQRTCLRVQAITKDFGKFRALNDINLDVREGEFVCFLGPSGCGKTTLLRIIAGLEPQTEGQIFQNDVDISHAPPGGRDFGIVFQSYALFPNLNVAKNVAYGLHSTGATRSASAARVQELLDLVGLPDQQDKFPAQLSGGQQQRVALARALAISPGLLLLDEPLSALDARVRTHLRKEIKDLQRRLGVTTIMVTHDQEEALTMADRIVVMNQGVIEQVGTPTEIYRQPETLFVADFIGSMNKVAGTVVNATSVDLNGIRLNCMSHSHVSNSDIIATIRPEDIVPAELDSDQSQQQNRLTVVVSDMEFLGSFWRCELRSDELAPGCLQADFSANAVRRLQIAMQSEITVQLPADRVGVYAST